MMSIFKVTFVALRRPWLVEVPDDPDPETLGLMETASNDGFTAAGSCVKTEYDANIKATTEPVS
jgi:hypothetical protein